MTTSAPRSCALTEAANPAAPNPATMTSASTSQVSGTVLIVLFLSYRTCSAGRAATAIEEGLRSAPFGLAAGQCDRDVPHRRVGLGAVPVALAGLDMRDVADIDLALFVLVGDHAGAGHDDQQLVAIMRVPAGRAALAEI